MSHTACPVINVSYVIDNRKNMAVKVGTSIQTGQPELLAHLPDPLCPVCARN